MSLNLTLKLLLDFIGTGKFHIVSLFCGNPHSQANSMLLPVVCPYLLCWYPSLKG